MVLHPALGGFPVPGIGDENASRLLHIFQRDTLRTFIRLGREVAGSRWSLVLDGHIGLFFIKSGYGLKGNTLSLEKYFRERSFF